MNYKDKQDQLFAELYSRMFPTLLHIPHRERVLMATRALEVLTARLTSETSDFYQLGRIDSPQDQWQELAQYYGLIPNYHGKTA